MFFENQIRFGLNVIKNPQIFLNIKGLHTIDGRYISKWKIIPYMAKSLYKFPGLYRYRIDPGIKGLTELIYLILSAPERVHEMQKKGKIVIGKWAVNPTDLYYSSGAIALDPFFLSFCYMLATDSNELAIRGRAELSPDACPAQAAAYIALTQNLVHLNCFYPFIGPWCYDSQYCFESLRAKFKGYFGGQPSMPNKGYYKLTLEYLIGEIKNFYKRVEELTHIPYNPERLRHEFIFENKMRKILREAHHMMLGDVVPMGSLELILLTFLACDWVSDPIAAYEMMELMINDLRKRVKAGVFGRGVSKNPVRLLISGIAWGDLGVYNIVDDLGGVIIGSECVISTYWKDINNNPDKDPIEILAERFMEVPYTYTGQEKAMWTVENIKQMKNLDGVIININFGCNYVAANTRILQDTIKKETGMPVLVIDSDLPGENREQIRTRIGAFIEMIKQKK
ncbi:MAG: 2-hydroxyacyl-CoA dehydratase [Candidatus Firestonebacteria bacterium]|nr:2-hydroxyacyl-CoA dehydratase [Candidatus Firestonebacteria bacterium]